MDTKARISEIMNIIEHANCGHVQDIQFYTGYNEPGYTDPESGIIALGNWNNDTKYDPMLKRQVTVSTYPSRISRLFEKLGVEIEWSDEWSSCGDCGKLFRTSPDSYGWLPSYVADDSGYLCHVCVEADPETHLESLEGHTNRCNTISDINPSEHGYVKFNGQFETGFHPGQTDDPKKVAEELRAKGIARFLFNMDSVGQFDQHWSAWVHESEIRLLKKPIVPIITANSSVKMTMEEYREHCDSYDGICLACGEVKFGDCEPDAESYICPECSSDSVMGIELALIAGLIEIKDGG